jgi:hypothetical protein
LLTEENANRRRHSATRETGRATSRGGWDRAETNAKKMSRRADLFDLTNVSPLCVSRAAWLSRGKSGDGDGDAADGSFPFSVSPTAEVYAARRARDDDGGDADAGRKPATTCVAVVKSVSTTSAGTEVRVVVPEVKKRDDDDDDDDEEEDDDGIVEEEDTNAIFEARLRAAMDAEGKGVSLDRMFGVKGGVQNSPVRTSVSAEEEEEEEEVPVPSSSPIPAESPVIDAMDIDANAPVFIAEAASPVGCAAREPEADDLSASDAAFERMLARAMTKPETPVEKQPLERAVPKKTFEPKLLVKSPEKYEPAVKPTVSTASSLDFEAKLEAALRAAEAGGDLTAILSGPSQKTMHSPAGANDTAESRVNYRELGFTRAEREHHRLHVAENDAR